MEFFNYVDEFMLKMIAQTVSELLISTTQEKLISLIKENPNITQEQLAVRLGLTRDGVSYNIKN